MKRQFWLEFRIPPTIVTVIFAYIIYLTSDLRIWQFTGLASDWFGIILACSGGLTMALGIFTFRCQKTTVNPLAPEQASKLVNKGIYKFTRNPMYLGMAVLLAAWCTYLASTTGWLLLLVFVAFITKFQILPEERILVEKFGTDFENYQNEVRRWL
ncbi:MAG: isoprenylcysteine carboxylmethyltransferase family protein [Acidiferrobacterales bacterium]|nr:isoprenylcysteine carboxylmethyltransferase family protein [Acidiferrobacterales bacterium]